MAGRSCIRCHYSLIFVPQTVLREDVTSRSQMILADYPGASEGNRTPVCRMAIYCTSRCTTPAWYLRSQHGSSVLVPHLSNLLPIFAGIYGEGTFLSMLAYGTNYGEWCGVTGSNRRPYACKAYALPAELTPHMELPVRFELTTYALLVRCSGQLSYGSIW